MAIEDAWSVATKRRGVYNLIQVPMRLERLLILGQFICLHELLGLFTMLPVRVALGVVRVPWSLVTSRKRGWARTAIDALHLSLLMITAVMLRLFDISWIYHNIRGQSVIKLYVVFNVIEIFDRLCSSFGVDILDSLGWTTHSAILFFSRPRQGGRSALAKATALQGLALVSRVVFDYLFALFYVLLHATLLLTWVVTLNVAINTQNNALLTLLVSNNFVELKGAVFKPFKVQNLFQIACSDGVERFQMTVFLGIMLMVTRGDERLFSVWGIIYGCEVIVDWVKHAFVTKFNRIPHRVYHQFSLVICDDMARVKSHSMVRSIGGSGVSKRIGFVSLPLAALVARMAWSSIIRLPRFAAAVLWISLMGFKMALGMCLVGHAWRKTKGMNAGVEVAEDGDGFWVQKLLQVERYELIAKN